MAESKSGGVSGREVFNPNKIYNVSEEEMRAIQERAKMREAMKLEFRKKVTNPYAGVGGYIFDPQMQRFLSMRATFWDQFKPAPKNFLFAVSVFFLPTALLTYYLQVTRTKREQKFRNGEVAYADRMNKFI